MVALTDLWLPILISAIAIFFLSFLMWMVLPHHRKDFGAVPDEDGLMSTLRAQGVKPGLYAIPHCGDPAQMKDEVWMKKRNDGPSGFLNVVPTGAWHMGGALGRWFVLVFAISVVTAYVGTIALPAGAEFMTVYRLTGACLLLAFCSNLFSDCIWKNHPLKMVMMHAFDGVVYALVAGGIFGWLWPEAALRI